MPPETFVGSEISTLLARARGALGADAVLVSVRRVGRGKEAAFEVVADVAPALAPVPAPAPPRRPRVEDAAIAAPKMESSKPAVTRAFSAAATSMLPQIGDHLSRRNREPAVLALVGPTGAGKTTTIAKLARHRKVFDGIPVGLLCLDTYRVGAVEQLRIWADIARLPLEVAYDAKDVRRAMKRLRDCELVLVDTAGRGPAAAADLDETRQRLAELAPFEVHLTLPAGLDPGAARLLVARHRALSFTHLIATKLDEFPDDDSVFALARELGVPMRWCTNGQEVPMDLQAAAPRLASTGGARLPEGAPLA